LAGNGNGTFIPLKSAQTGFKADGDVKSIAEITAPNKTRLILVGNNSGAMQAFQHPNNGTDIPVKSGDVYAILKLKNGQQYKQEFYYGSNYLSQTARMLQVHKDAVGVTIFTNQNTKREYIVQEP
jgi:enediyne biosynthesis protein E4